MLINKLCDLYDRLSPNMPPVGYEYKNVAGCIDILDIDIYRVEIYEEGDDKGKPFLAPKWIVRSTNISPNFLTDTSKYTIGVTINKDKPVLAPKHFEAFRDYHIQLCNDIDNPDIRLFLNFLMSWDPTKCLENEQLNNLFGKIISFNIKGKPIINYDELKEVWDKAYIDMLECEEGVCSIYGEEEYIPRLHHQVQMCGEKVSLVSFNTECAESYGFKQAYNSSIGYKAMFKYTTTLNTLVRDNRFNVRNKNFIYIFWSERDNSKLAPMLKSLLESNKADDIELQNMIKNYLKAAQLNDYVPNNNICIAGLAAGRGRASVDFIYENDVSMFIQTINTHFENLYLKDIPAELNMPSLRTLVWYIVPEHIQNKSYMDILYQKSINLLLTHGKYLLELYKIVLNHLNRVPPRQLGRKTLLMKIRFIKAVLIANYHFKGGNLMKLNKDIKDVAYLLGRLFAVLDKIQSDVVGSKKTLSDKYWAKASKIPQRIFPVLFDHVHKLLPEHKYRIKYEKDIEEIVSNIDKFPTSFDESERGLFVLGFYHQRQAFFEKNEENVEKED